MLIIWCDEIIYYRCWFIYIERRSDADWIGLWIVWTSCVDINCWLILCKCLCVSGDFLFSLSHICVVFNVFFIQKQHTNSHECIVTVGTLIECRWWRRRWRLQFWAGCHCTATRHHNIVRINFRIKVIATHHMVGVLLKVDFNAWLRRWRRWGRWRWRWYWRQLHISRHNQFRQVRFQFLYAHNCWSVGVCSALSDESAFIIIFRLFNLHVYKFTNLWLTKTIFEQINKKKKTLLGASRLNIFIHTKWVQ